MEAEEFFEGEKTTPSVISVVVGACVDHLGEYYKVNQSGSFYVISGNGRAYPVRDEEMIADVCSWVRALDTGNPMKDKLKAMLTGNPGWEMVIARRAIREMRKRAA